MPTIDELAPAASASDSDEFLVSQSGIARKVTRTQILNGVQVQLAVQPGSLLGRISTGVGAPEMISVGANLSFNGSTLSASASPFVVGKLPAGTVPATGDLIPMSQAGTSTAVTYGQFISGMANAPAVNLSQALVTPTGATTSRTLAQITASLLPLSGGTMTGALTLAGTPSAPLQASSKGYVDQQLATSLPLTGGTLIGALTLAGAPQRALDAATKAYADSVTSGSVATSGGTLTGALLLASDPSVPLQATTKRYADLKVARSGDTFSGPVVLSGEPVQAQQAATKSYVDGQIVTVLPRSGGTLTGALFLAADPVGNGQAATKQYADQKVARAGDSLTGPLMLAADPTQPLQAATKNYVDGQASGSLFRSGASMTGALLLASDPSAPLQASTKQYVDLRVSRSGDTLTGALLLAGNPSAPLQAATKQYVDGQIGSAVTSAGTTFTGVVALGSDPTSANHAATKRYVDTKLSRTGDTLTGALVLAADPSYPSQATTKSYVDAQVQTALPRSGGTLSGSLSLASDPTGPSQAATKAYVDGLRATALPLTGGSLSGVLSLSGLPTSPSNATSKQYVDTQLATALAVSGGTLAGPLTLAGGPTAPLHAATKAYVDANPSAMKVINVALPPYGAKLDGVTDDTAAFKAAYQAAPVGSAIYVPNGTTVLQSPGSWGVALSKRVKWIVDGTVLSDGTPLGSSNPTGGSPSSLCLPGLVVGNTLSSLTTSQGSSQADDFAVSQSSYIVGHNGGPNAAVVANSRTDTIIYNSPGTYVWGGIDRLIWAGIQTPTASTPAQHVGRYIQTLRQVARNDANGQALPQPQLWAACMEYRDLTGRPSSATGAAITVEMDWFGNGFDDANVREIQSLVIGQHDTAGTPVQVSTIIGAYLAAGSKGSAKTVFSIGVPFSNAVLDTTNAQQIYGAPVIRMAAGQAIAFEATNSYNLQFDDPTGTLRWNQGSSSYVIGKGISVGWVNSYSTSTTLQNYNSGNMILLSGNSGYSITLPKANTLAAGSGFTFSVTGTGPVSILPNRSDTIISGSVILHANDRYHIVSDGATSWYELFWTNAVSPRFSGPIVLPSYTVANLPGNAVAGAKAFATNGRKPAEASGSGSGVEVFFDGQHWISSCAGTLVAA